MTHPKLAVILPALNEERAIGPVIDAILRTVPDARVLVADNGSRDRTADVARARGAEVIHEPRRGYGSACLAAQRALRDEEIVVYVDADGAADPAEIPNLIQPIVESGADMVIGSRLLGICEPGSLTLPARFGNWLAPALIRIFFDHAYTDLGPFRAIRRDALDRLEMCDLDYGWTVEMQIKAVTAGLKIAEVPASWRNRTGESKISGTVRGVVGAGYKILTTIGRYAIRDMMSRPPIRRLIALGLALLFGYSLMTLIATGIGASTGAVLKSILPSAVNAEIDRWIIGFSTFYDVPNSAVPIRSFVLLFLALFVVYLFAVRHVMHVGRLRGALPLIILFAILFRMPLIPSPLILENDIYRHLWDGKTVREGINPYRFTPEEVMDAAADAIHDERLRLNAASRHGQEARDAFRWMGHKDVATVYPPMAQAAFLIPALIRPDSVAVFKSVVFLFDMGIVILLIAICARMNRNPCAVLIYAWSPLVIKEFSNSGHMDVIALFFIVLALYFALRPMKLGAGLALAAAILAKWFPAILIPALARRLGRFGLTVAVCVIAAGVLPFLLDAYLLQSGDVVARARGAADEFTRGLRTYGRDWQNNASVYPLLKSALGGDSMAAKRISGMLAAMLACFIAARRASSTRILCRQILWTLAALLILSPTAYPWYFTWLVPILVLHMNRALLILTGTICLYYVSFIPGPPPEWLPWAEYLPALVLAIIAVYRNWASAGSKAQGARRKV